MYDEHFLKESGGAFHCVPCVQADESGALRAAASWGRSGAEVLPHTQLSRHIEAAVAADLAAHAITAQPVREQRGAAAGASALLTVSACRCARAAASAAPPR